MNLGAAETSTAILDASLSRKGVIELFASVFGAAFFEAGTEGGGISAGPGSLNGTILESGAVALDVPGPEPEMTRLDRPACFRVDPASFFTSGTFSLILVLRVPRSGHAFMGGSADCEAEPVGSTNTCIGALEPDATTVGVDGIREVEAVASTDDVASASLFGLDGALVVGGGDGRDVALIMRFWNSWCRACKCSTGDARLAIPNV